MTCFRIGKFGTSATPIYEGASSSTCQPVSSSGRVFQPLVDFSTHQDRAGLADPPTSAPSSRSFYRQPRSSKAAKTAASASPRRRRRKTTRVIRGRVAIRVPGFKTVQHLGASQLVKFIPVNKLRTAARRVLGKRSGGKTRYSRRRRKGRILKRRRRTRRKTRRRTRRVRRRGRR